MVSRHAHHFALDGSGSGLVLIAPRRGYGHHPVVGVVRIVAFRVPQVDGALSLRRHRYRPFAHIVSLFHRGLHHVARRLLLYLARIDELCSGQAGGLRVAVRCPIVGGAYCVRRFLAVRVEELRQAVHALRAAIEVGLRAQPHRVGVGVHLIRTERMLLVHKGQVPHRIVRRYLIRRGRVPRPLLYAQETLHTSLPCPLWLIRFRVIVQVHWHWLPIVSPEIERGKSSPCIRVTWTW